MCRNAKICMTLIWKHHVLHDTSRKSVRNIKTLCIGSTYSLLNRKDLSSIKHDRTQSSFTTHSQLIVSRKLFGWKLEKSYTRKYMRRLDLLRRFPSKITGGNYWVQKLLEVVKTPNKPNQKPKTQLSSTGRLVKSEQPTGSLIQEIDKDVLFGCESTNETCEQLRASVC